MLSMEADTQRGSSAKGQMHVRHDQKSPFVVVTMALWPVAASAFILDEQE